jgi:hypothetical protein
MQININKITLKGHNSFYLRDGWLNKVFLQDNVEFLKDPMESSLVLGVGSGMVKSIRFYLSAMGLVNFSSRNKMETDLFLLIKDHDPILEYNFTKYILHYMLVSNASRATAWNTFFNYINFDEITKEELFNNIQVIFKEALPEANYSLKSLSDDIDCLIRLYTKNSDKNATPEDNLESPLAVLSLLGFDGKKIKKVMPSQDKLSEEVILYVLLSEIDKKGIESIDGMYSISLDEIMTAANNIGKIFNLSKVEVYYYLHKLAVDSFITLHETAGLDQVYISDKIKKEDVFINFFKG